MIGSALRSGLLPSPNFEPRRDGRKPDMLLLHYTGMASADAACTRLCDAAAKVSCHYFVHEDGRIIQMVDEQMRAWHAGLSHWKGEEDINSCSIGIEIHNIGHNGDYPDFTEAQMAAVTALSADIVKRNGIAAERVLGHSDVAPGRKADPGEKFDWKRLSEAGAGVWVEPSPLQPGLLLARGSMGREVSALQHMLAEIGYGLQVNGSYDDRTFAVVEAFQRHFRPARVDGIADVSTRETLIALRAALPAAGGTV